MYKSIAQCRHSTAAPRRKQNNKHCSGMEAALSTSHGASVIVDASVATILIIQSLVLWLTAFTRQQQSASLDEKILLPTKMIPLWGKEAREESKGEFVWWRGTNIRRKNGFKPKWLARKLKFGILEKSKFFRKNGKNDRKQSVAHNCTTQASSSYIVNCV